jgi:hypothetical protein
MEDVWPGPSLKQTFRSQGSRGDGATAPAGKKRDAFKNNLSGFWKQFPDAYLSWALAVSAVSEGHLFVDLLPHTAQMYELSKDEVEVVGRRFENAAREFLDTKHVIRIVCSRDMTPEYFYFVFATNLLQQQETSELPFVTASGRSSSTAAPRGHRGSVGPQGRRSRSAAARGGEGGKQSAASQQHSQQQRSGKAPRGRPSLKFSDAPFVLILQGVEALSYDAQLALSEILTRKQMPGSFVPNLLSQGGSVSEGAIPVRGLFELKHPHVVVALSTSLQVPTAECGAGRSGLGGLGASAPLMRFSDSPHVLDDSSLPQDLQQQQQLLLVQEQQQQQQQQQQLLLLQLGAQFFESFLLRIPIKLPERFHILSVDHQTSFSPRHGSMQQPHAQQQPYQQGHHHHHHNHHHLLHHELGQGQHGQGQGLEEDPEPYAPFRGPLAGLQPPPPPPYPPPPLSPGAGSGRARRMLWPRADDTVHQGRLVIPKPSSEDEPKATYVMAVDLRQQRELAASVYLSFELDMHLSNIITALRMHPFVLSGPPPRVLPMLANSVRAVAGIVHGQGFVTPAHVTEVVVEALAHHLVLAFQPFPDIMFHDHTPPWRGTLAPRSHPRDWHPLTAARYIVAETTQYVVPPPGRR